MDVLTCEYCGMTFEANLPNCPICGKEAPIMPLDFYQDQAQPIIQNQKPTKGGAFSEARKKKTKSAANQNVYGVPKWVMITLCSILGVLCLLGAVFGIYNVGYAWEPISMLALFEKEQPETIPDEISETEPTQIDYINEEDQTIQEVDEPVEKIVLCTGISLGKTSITFEEAESFDNLTYVLSPADCTEEVQFLSADESIATVNSNGKVVAISGGSTEITVSCGTQTANCLVTCDFMLAAGEENRNPPQLGSEDITFFSPGEQYAITVSNIAEDTKITYESSRPNVASVSETGVVTAMGIGSSDITVTVMLDEPVVLSMIVRCNLSNVAETVEGAIGDCKISHSDVSMSFSGEYFDLYLKDAEGKKVKDITWVSGNSSVCTVTQEGKVTAVGSGTTTVSTLYGGVSYQCIVRCNIG